MLSFSPSRLTSGQNENELTGKQTGGQTEQWTVEQMGMAEYREEKIERNKEK